MQTITEAQFDQMAREGTILAMGRAVPKVIRKPDGTIIKLFRRKRWNITGLIWPYAQRFTNAARILTERGIPTVTVTGTYHVGHLGVDAVTYPALPGEPLRDRLAATTDIHIKRALLSHAARFLARLHDKGIYFRGVHFGNILVTGGTDAFALIDLSAAKFLPRRLRARRRARNFKPLLVYPEDAAAIEEFGGVEFLQAYLSAADMPEPMQALFLRKVAAIDPRFAAAIPQVSDTGGTAPAATGSHL